MFSFLKKKNKHENGVKPLPELSDLDGMTLKEGDIVEVLRYELGQCRIVVEDKKYYYESLTTGERVSWVKMIDASTNFQKVRKVKDS